MEKKIDVLMRNRSRLPEAVYGRDPGGLGHYFFAITGRTDQCDNCGCQVGETSNRPGLSGGRYDEACREQAWKCDVCCRWLPSNAPTTGFPDVICRQCAAEIAANA